MTKPEDGAVRLSERLYRLLLRAYPRDFRQAFGEEMARTFRDTLRAERHRRGGVFAGFWMRVIGDVISSALRERSEAMERGAIVVLVVALTLGLLIGLVDSSPNWDDTGITAMAIFITCAILGAISPSRPWLWAMAVGLWIPAMPILRGHPINYGSFIALAFAFAGAYAGAFGRKLLSGASGTA